MRDAISRCCGPRDDDHRESRSEKPYLELLSFLSINLIHVVRLPERRRLRRQRHRLNTFVNQRFLTYE
ncbi:MAG: hypothetical protein QOG73_3683 [Acetobacteraceae bacterium]|jgi:hypothetical protein|nr:hypothetical protein [Acetobacteraceae bacterium]